MGIYNDIYRSRYWLTATATLVVLAGAALMAILPAPPAQAAEWKGEDTTKDGIRCLVSPASPMESPAASDLQELWQIGGDTDDEDEFFGVISQIQTDQSGNIYLLDSQLNQVKVFDPDGGFVRDIGREGEGPGEFRGPTSMFFTRDGNVAVLQLAPGKIVLLTPEGEPAGEHPLPVREDGGMIILVGGNYRGGNFVLAGAANAFSEGRFDQERYLASVAPDGKETARYHSETRTIDFASPVLDDKVWDTFDRRWTIGTDGRVYACTSYDDYRIQIWKPDGTPDRIIERAYDHQKRTAEEKKIVEDLMGLFANQIPNATVKISDYNKDIETIFVREDGSLWVLTSDGTRSLPDGVIGVFDVFDPEGRFSKQITLKGEGDPLTDGYYFVEDRVYIVTDLLQAAISLQSGGQSFQIGDEEAEPMSVICYQLEGSL
ncbi:MAG: 6-bladed beta-propeller [Candidatus Latescibacterota bacterium]|nr:MAG: 6-bladed beta-propeller [Candidatus Latescibacterota bacterium]